MANDNNSNSHSIPDTSEPDMPDAGVLAGAERIASDLRHDGRHNRLELLDKLALVGELEHLRRHTLRSMTADEEDEVYYHTIADEVKELRRNFMRFELLPALSEKDWCIVKSAASIRQLTYELSLTPETTKDIDRLIDEIYTWTFDQDMSGCASCREDKGE